MPNYTISSARESDLAFLAAIELAAARLLEGHAPESVLATTSSERELRRAAETGLLWIARFDDAPVGFALARILEAGSLHLEELNVHPSHGRRGIGTRLVATVCDWAEANGYGAVTLSTFRRVPWNMPFYARMGFKVVLPSALTAPLRELVAIEASHGLDVSKRVIMRRGAQSSSVAATNFGTMPRAK